MSTITAAATRIYLAVPPNPGQGVAPPGSAGIITAVGWVAWVVFAIAVVGILVCAAKMMGGNGNGHQNHGANLGWVLGGAIIAASASGIVGTVAVTS